jgi:hypothetical protein
LPVVYPHLFPRIIFYGLEFVAQGLYNILKGELFLGDEKLEV